ncbi:MAG: DUF1593 domain-containing protein [Bacteroidales bacterium]|nr:DUF1593 domain-containing protein [Bacteroidales bacterium]
MVLGWGGTNTLGAAVMKVKNTRTTAQAQAFVAKIRGYEIALQDDGFAYISHNYPSAKLISSKSAWKGISKTVPAFNAWSESWGGNNYVLNQGWADANIKNNHGALGSKYLNAAYLFEGDSPSFLYLIPNGMSSPENLGFGGWGGRFNTTKTTNVTSGTNNGSLIDNALNGQRDYAMYTEAKDSWTYTPAPYWSNGSTIANPDAAATYTNNEYAAIFRWREAFQYDFAARMDWCTQSYSNANHPPVANVDGSLYLTVAGGSTVNLSANGSSDPDGNSLSYNWMYYREAGAYNGNITITNANSMNASLVVPTVTANTDIHIILSVKDNGSPNLTRYQRVIITIVNEVVPVTGVTISNCPSADVALGATTDLTEVVAPSNASNKSVSWTSSNSSIATVSSTGLVTGLAAGNATITVTTADGGFTASCNIAVVPVAVTGVSITNSPGSPVAVGASYDLDETVTPANASNKSVTWARTILRLPP